MEHVFTMDNFETEVLGSDIPVLVDFYADWCGPCKMMAPVVDKMAEVFDGKLKVGKLNIDDNMAIAEKYGIQSIPNFIIFKGGQVAASNLGAMGLDAFKSWIEGAL
ncbi:MAG: thioredoxin [Lachnospiraceae bacterium]|nr:thioredoxin [Lachnospiraceae bacterium]